MMMNEDRCLMLYLDDGLERLREISQRYSVQGYRENMLDHTKSAITLIFYLYSLYTTDHSVSCAILCSCQSLCYVQCFHSYYLMWL